MPTPARSQMQGLALLFITTVLWGCSWPMTKYLLSVLPPFSARAMPGLIGATLTMIVAASRGDRLLPRPAEWGRLTLAALLNFSAWMGFTVLALQWLSTSETVIIAYTLPIWTALLAWPLLGERPTLGRSFGIVLGLSGVILLVAADPQPGAWSKLPGCALALAASILFGLGTVLSKRAPLALPPVTAVAWQIGIGSLPFLLAIPFERPDFAHASAVTWLILICSGTLVLGLGYMTWFAALRRLTASLAAIGSLLVPAIGVSAAALVLREPLGLREIAALALTLSGVAVASRL